MGLLSDPEYGSVKWVKLLKKVHAPLCFLCYLGALTWFVMLGNRHFNNETYFSENALLPGLVTNEFNGEHAAKQFYNEFLQELGDKYDDSAEMPVPWLLAKMSQLHLEVYTHNFTLNYPLGQGEVYKGTNVYGILRAPRTSSLEALVVSAPFRSLSCHQKGTGAGIALMLAFAQFARPQKYWAKDIIFLVTEHEQLGMQAWLEAYHGLQHESDTFYTSLGSFWQPGTPTWELNKIIPGLWSDHQKCLDPGKLKGRSGSIQAAINLEFHVPNVKYIEVKVEGLNGQLPNLDLVNLVHKLCVKSAIHHSYKNSYSWVRSFNYKEQWINNLWTMLGMVSAQMAGVPNGNHGLFHRFNIEAVTLEGREAVDPAGRAPGAQSLSPTNFYRLGIALESTLRSLNNLLERFHQSYFFYILAATDRFISIGQYMPSLCLLCVAMLIRALYLWVSLQQDDEDDVQSVQNRQKDEHSDTESDQNQPTKKDKSDTDERTDTKSSKNAKNKPKNGINEESTMSVVNIGANYLVVHLLGYGIMNSPTIFSKIGAFYYEETSENSVFTGFLATSGFLILTGPFIPRIFRRGGLTPQEACLVNILVLVELATLCLTVGMHNYSLGLVIAVVYTPLALVARVNVRGKTRRVFIVVKRLFCITLQPLVMLSVCMTAYSAIIFPEDNVKEMMVRGRDAATQAVMFSIVDSLVYGNWLFNVVTSLLLPIWIIFWQISCCTVEASVEKK